MTTDSTNATEPTAKAQLANSAKELQTRVCALMAATVIVSFFAIGVASRSRPINDWLLARQLHRWKSTNSKYQYNRGYIDHEGRLVYDELRSADYSQGGVYFMGSSTTVNSLLFWELPTAQQRLIHNYALGGAGPMEWRAFLRHLVDEDGLLKAGADKTMIVFGLYHPDFIGAVGRMNAGFATGVFQRHGLYEYTNGKIHHAKLSVPVRWILAEKARCSNFLHYLMGHMAFRANPPVTEGQKRAYCKLFTQRSGSHYAEQMQGRIDDFEQLIDELHAKGVRVAAYLCPLGSWFRGDHGEYPQSKMFHEKISELCARKMVPLADYQTLFADDDFFDQGHANYHGQSKIHPYLVDTAVRFLELTGALPPHDAAAQPRQ